MIKPHKLTQVLAFASLIVFLTEKPAHAYLDAGVGSLLLQLVLAGSAGILVLLKMWWARIGKLLRFSKQKPAKSIARRAA